MGSMKKRSSLLRVVLTLGAIALFSLAVGVTQVQAGERLLLTVETDPTTFDTPIGIPGPFNIEGEVFVGDDLVGTFQCWGWILVDFSTNVSQVYNIGDSAIMTQGIEGGFLAVVGGTGVYRNVRGEGEQVFFTPDDFTLDLNLAGVEDEDDDEEDDDDDDD